ncbi:hypothetical protein HID58_059909 [Brassica napus]|uniref:RING-type E3 ubiquitin transferase n=1 Tax=Brassica napus TaxID=3708 RepID=A0ABQ7ZUI3_BRANA|nr:hypothetical protein HID58_059909 [Brassica napus]
MSKPVFHSGQSHSALGLRSGWCDCGDGLWLERSFQTGGDKSFQGMHRKVRSIGSGLQFFIYRVQCHD